MELRLQGRRYGRRHGIRRQPRRAHSEEARRIRGIAGTAGRRHEHGRAGYQIRQRQGNDLCRAGRGGACCRQGPGRPHEVACRLEAERRPRPFTGQQGEDLRSPGGLRRDGKDAQSPAGITGDKGRPGQKSPRVAQKNLRRNTEAIMKTNLTWKQVREALKEKTKLVGQIFQEAGEDLDFSKVKCLEGTDTQSKVEIMHALEAELTDLKKDDEEYQRLSDGRKALDEKAGF